MKHFETSYADQFVNKSDILRKINGVINNIQENNIEF